MNLNDDYTYMVGKIGPPSEVTKLSDAQIRYVKEHLPKCFCDFLELYGFGAYFDGGYQFVDPEAFKPVASLIFRGDTDLSVDDCHIVSYSAFGKLRAWSERHWLVEIDLLEYQIWSSRLFGTAFNLPSHLVPKIEPSAERAANGLLPGEQDDRELWDVNEKPMFARCAKAQGALQRNECFGFVPSLGLVGFNSNFRVVENVNRLPALEHFAMISQMHPFRLTRMGTGGYEYLREIG